MYPKYKTKVIRMAEEERAWSQERVNQIRSEKTKAARKGEEAEVMVMELAKLLHSVKHVWRASLGSELDQTIKGDVIVDLEDDESFVLQVKSSWHEAHKYEELPPPSYKGFNLPKVPVTVTEGKDGWQLLQELSESTGLPVNDSILKGVLLLETAKKGGLVKFPSSIIKPGLLSNLTRLGLLRMERGEHYIV